MPILQRCRGCGNTEGFDGLVSGLCPACSQRRSAILSRLLRSYQDSVDNVDPAVSPAVCNLIREYIQSEGARSTQFWGAHKIEP